MNRSLYAEPRRGLTPDDCYFYHTMEIPPWGLQKGEWDLTHVPEHYLGGVDLKGKTVLEIGAASGFLTLNMEQMGAEVTAFDLNEDYLADNLIPAAQDRKKYLADYRDFMLRLNNSFWLTHEAHGLKAKMVYGTVYDIPAELDAMDAATCSCVLLHLRDPFRALQNIANQTLDHLIITEPLWNDSIHSLHSKLQRRVARCTGLRDYTPRAGAPLFVMNPSDKQQHTWWMHSPEIITQYVEILGFEVERLSLHTQVQGQDHKRMFSLVARRVSEGMRGLY